MPFIILFFVKDVLTLFVNYVTTLNNYVPNEIIIKYDADINTESLEEIIEINDYSINQVVESDIGMVNLDDFTGSNQIEISSGLYVLSFDESDLVSNVIEEISQFESIIYAQPNYIYKTCDVEPIECIDENEPKGPLSQQAMINSLNIGDNTETGDGVVVAVIDTGIDLSHPALAGSLWSENGVYGYDTNNNNSPITMAQDNIYTDEHGTHVAGIIAMQNVGEYQCKGIATGAKIMDLQASSTGGKFKTSSIIKALQIAEEHNADIVNMSFGTYSFDPLMCEACDKAARNMVLIAAAGNDSYNRTPLFPSALVSVISVSAYGGSSKAKEYSTFFYNNSSLLNANYPPSEDMTIADFSNYDTQEKYCDIFAPGVNICSTKAGGRDSTSGYIFYDGTSMAAPIISGVAALYKEKYPNATPGQIRHAIRSFSSKQVKPFKYLNIFSNIPSEELLQNQVDISHILNISPSNLIDQTYEHYNDPDYSEFCMFIKRRLKINDETYCLSTEDLRLLSFLYIEDFNMIVSFIDKLIELPNLYCIEIKDKSLNDEQLNELINGVNLTNLDIFVIEDSIINEFKLINSFCPNIYCIEFNNNYYLNKVFDLNCFTNLNKMVIYNSEISDLSFLSSVNTIELLDLHKNKIKDISSINNLNNIIYIDLSYNHITDISPICSLNKLKIAYFNNNYIIDASPFENLEHIEILNLNNNNIIELGQLLYNESLHSLKICENPEQPNHAIIDNYLNSKERIEKALDIYYKPFKQLIPAESVLSYDVTLKRTERFFNPSVCVFPFNASNQQCYNLYSCNSKIIVNPCSQTLSFNPNYSYNTNGPYTSEITYNVDGITGSFEANLLMPTIQCAVLEKYTINQTIEENYITVITTIDTTMIKIQHSNYLNEEFSVQSDDVFVEDHGNERIIKVKLYNSIIPNSTITVYAGDDIGYFASEIILNTNTVFFTVSNSTITQATGNADFVFINSEQIDCLDTNAFSTDVNINTLILSSHIQTISNNAFNSCNISELYIRCHNLQANNCFCNCTNMNVFVSHDSSVCDNINVIIHSDFQFNNNELIHYYGTQHNITIPKYLLIDTIGASAFHNKAFLESIDLSEIKYIKNNAFSDCANLSDVTSLERAREIGASAFKNCICLTDLKAPLKCVTIGNEAFENTKICSIYNNSNTLLSLGTSAFKDCANLKCSYLGMINALSEYCFCNCTQLAFISFKYEKYIDIKRNCFENCEFLSNIQFENIKNIGKQAFKNCSNFRGSILFNRIRTVGDEAFENCNNLLSICFDYDSSNYFLKVGSKAFNGANSLQSIGLIADNCTCKTDSFDNSSNNLTIFTNGLSLKNSDTNEYYNSSTVNVCTDFILNKNQSNKVVLSNYNGNESSVVIPDCLNIYEIGERVFYLNSSINSVNISDSVVSINKNAFSMTDLCNITGGKNVNYVEELAFFDCTSLKDISTFDSIISIGNYAFCWTGIEKYTMSNTIMECGECAFLCCKQLNDIELSGQLLNVSDGCFYACDNLERCVLKYYITRIGEEAFFDCDNLKHLYIPKSVEAIRNNAFPSNVIIFCESTFSLKTQISRRFGNTVIPNYEVVDGTLLEYQSLTGYDYEDINQNKVIEVPNVVEEINEYMFYNNQIATKVILSDYLDVIQSRAFMFCNHIKTILMPSTMSYIGSNAFNKATMLEEITIPEGIETIKSNTFFQTRIKGCRIPDSVTEIESGAFWHCTQLKSVFIPDSVTSIANNAFADCNSYLILFGRNNSILPNYVNTNCDNNGNYTLKLKLGFEISDNALESYIGSEVNVQVPFGIGLQSISDEAFKNNTVIESVSIASEITEIGNECFSGCTSLSKIVIPDDVTTTGTDAFYGITNLTIYCNDNSDIEDYCLTNNISVITDYELEDGVLKCYNGNNISVFIPEDLCIMEVGQGAFYSSPNRSLIQSVTIPTGVLVISNNAFLWCSSISTISLPSTLKKCGIFAFSGCTGLTSINLPSSLEEIDAYAFYNCSNLSSIDLSNVVSISYNAFDNCSFLESATFSNVTESIGNNAFKDCDDLVFYCVLNSYAYNYAVNNNISYEIIQSRSIPLQHIERFTNESNNEIENELSNDVFNLERYIRETYNGDLSENDIIDIIEHIR